LGEAWCTSEAALTAIPGTIAVVLCYIILGWTKEIAGVFTNDAELVRYYNALGPATTTLAC